MGERSAYPPGTFCWVDLQTNDLESAQVFYGALLGWEFGDGPLATVGGAAVCALFETPSVPPHFNNYVAVASADETMARVPGLGGTVIEPPFDVPGGRLGLFTDPAGAALCVWEGREHPGAGRVNDVGCLCWNDLGTPDVEEAMAFYGALFGWTFDDGDYRMILNGSRLNGGLREDPSGRPGWMPYFTVESVDADVVRAATVHGPGAIDERARFAVLQDPQGAMLAVFEGPTED